MTLYENIFEIFLDKIKQDTDFFMYNLNENETKEIINKRCKGYLTYAIAEFKKSCVFMDISLDNKDDILECFNLDLTDVEIEIIAELMFIAYLNEDLSKLKVQTHYFSDKDLKLFTNKDDRNSYMSMFNTIKKEAKKSIKEYESKDRLTGQPKKMDYSALSMP